MQTILNLWQLTALLLLAAALWQTRAELKRVVTLDHDELERAKRAIGKLWTDRDELRAEVNRLHGYIGEKLSDAGLAPKTVMVSAIQEARSKGELPADLKVESVSVSAKGPRK